MDSSQDSLAPLAVKTQPATPEPAEDGADSLRTDTGNMTPPPSSQPPRSSNTGRKSRTPTPTFSHISTPPPTVDMSSAQAGRASPSGLGSGDMTTEDLASASAEDLRTRVVELQAALHQAKTSAAHHKLHYGMLAQETAACIERMAVEARMAQCETNVIHSAEQAKAAATPQPSPMQEGMIPVQKDLYQHMCREIQNLVESNHQLESDKLHLERTVTAQNHEIARLGDKVALMRERIMENREHLARYRRMSQSSRLDSTPRSVYTTPHRRQRQDQSQDPLHALVQASEMASSQEAQTPSYGRKGHVRNTHSMSSLPNTPNRASRPAYETPSHRHTQAKVPSTAPLPRTSAVRAPSIYSRHLPMSQPQLNSALSEGTVSASDDDSEAETDIIEDDEVNESQASKVASHMLRTSQEQPSSQRGSFKGDGMKQSTLFGAVRKPNNERPSKRAFSGDLPPTKRARASNGAVGLGIQGVKD